MRVLIFDDEDAIGRSVVRVATMAGMNAAAVTNAVDFEKNVVSDDPPQLIILDLQLADTDGIQQLRLLKSWNFNGTVVLLSGFDSRVLSAARSLAQNLGLNVDGVLQKPLNLARLEELFAGFRTKGEPLTVERVRQAIDNNEMYLEFQPIVNRGSNEISKLEALIRWKHPVTGRVSPAEFVPLAESDTATIDAMTDWVVATAVKSYVILQKSEVAVPFSVNLSAKNLHDLTLPDRIEQHLRSGRMPARHLCLEITETTVYKDYLSTMDILSRMRLKGMRLSIDDFGTGFSSLKLLRQMPFTEIKIDQSFVADVLTSRDSRAIVKSIIDLATNMDMACVAEGVETEDTANLLEQLGVNDLQGYLFARPMAVEMIPGWLKDWKVKNADARARDTAKCDAALLPGN